MSVLIFAIPISLTLSLGFLLAFLWAVDNEQIKDLEDKAEAILKENPTTENKS